MTIKSAILPLAIALGLSAQSPMQVQVIQPLNFGNLVVSNAGGAIRLTEEGILNPLSGEIWQGMKSFPTYGIVRVIGPAKAQFQVVFETPNPVLRGRGGALRIDELTCTLTNWRGSIGESGTAEFHIGAQLSVNAGTQPDTYMNPAVEFRVNLLGIPGVSGTAEGTARNSIRMIGNLIPSIKLERIRDLEFGGLVPGAVDGLFHVLPSGGHTTPDPGGPSLFRGQPSAAEFSLSGAPGANYSIQLPEALTMTGPGGIAIRVQDFQIDQPLQGLIPASGRLTFGTGASLMVLRSQPAGNYSGQFTITVSYQ